MRTNNLFNKLALQDLYRLIVKGDSQSDEAAHYLIRVRMHTLLKDMYTVFESRCQDEYDDVLTDFYLYLREGAHADNNVPYEALLGLQHPEALASWMQSTFRNYLNNRAALVAKAKDLLSEYQEEVVVGESFDIQADTEQKIETFAHLVAYMLHVLQPRERFILLRWLLTILDKSKALPEKEMAKAMGLSYEAYRVIVYRIKMQLRHNLSILMQQEELELLINSGTDEDCNCVNYLAVVSDINEHFADLYNCLLKYYEGTMAILPNSGTIAELRFARQEERGFSVHDASTIQYPKPVVAILKNFYQQIMM